MGQRIYWLVGMNNQVRLGWQDVLDGQPCSGWPSPSPPQSPQKRFEGHSRSYPGVPLDEEGGDLLSRIAVQYHRRARA